MLVLPTTVDAEYVRQVSVLSFLTHGSLVGGSQRIIAHGVLRLGAVFPMHFMPKFHSDRTGNVMLHVETLVPLRITQATLLGIQHGKALLVHRGERIWSLVCLRTTCWISL
jgi:hypothetical protein